MRGAMCNSSNDACRDHVLQRETVFDLFPHNTGRIGGKLHFCEEWSFIGCSLSVICYNANDFRENVLIGDIILKGYLSII